MFACYLQITTNSQFILGISATSFQSKTTTSVITVSWKSKYLFATVVLKEKERNECSNSLQVKLIISM